DRPWPPPVLSGLLFFLVAPPLVHAFLAGLGGVHRLFRFGAFLWPWAVLGLFVVRLGRREFRRELVALRLQLRGVKLQERLTRVHHVALADEHLFDAAADLGAEPQ